METKVYFVPCNNVTLTTIDYILDNFICFVETDIVEMNYLRVAIQCRIEDVKRVDKLMTDLI